jgi:hypothetical protein
MATEKPNLTRVWAKDAPTPNVVDPDTTSAGKVAEGWQAEIPPFEHFNFLQKWFSQGLAHINEQGIAVWDPNTTYPKGGIVKGSDGSVYYAISEQSNNNPTTDDGTYWNPVGTSSTIDNLKELSPDQDGTLIVLTDPIRFGRFRWKIGDFTSGVLSDPLEGVYIGATSDPTGAEGCWVREIGRVLTPEMFGASTGSDRTVEFQACVNFCGTSNIREIQLGAGDYRLNTIHKTFNNLTIRGIQDTRVDKGGTRISFIGTDGALFENGADDEQPWDDNLYDGPQGLSLKNLNLYNASPNRTTALNNTASSYSVDSYAVRDWRGGHIEYENIFVEGFEYSFWGINSDFNKFVNVTQAYTK